MGGRRELTSSLRLTTSAAYILGKTVSTARDPAAVPAHASGLAMRRLSPTNLPCGEAMLARGNVFFLS